MDFFQNRDLDLILTERATRFYDPKLSGIEKEKCILVAVDTKLETRRAHVESAPIFSLKESLRCVVLFSPCPIPPSPLVLPFFFTISFFFFLSLPFSFSFHVFLFLFLIQ
jgi:hypothetical protein